MKKSKKVGLSPGSLVFVGKKKIEKTTIEIIDYDQTNIREEKATEIEECFAFKETSTVTWLNINGLHDTELIDKLGKHYDIHPLIIEDVLNTHQRPKIEILENYIFIVLKMLFYDEKKSKIEHEQISIILGATYVISLQEREGDVFDPLRERIRKANGRIRTMGTDYLAYALIDTIIDNYFLVLEKLGDNIEIYEKELMSEPKSDILREVYQLKKEILFLRKSLWPLREVVSELERSESPIIKKKTKVFLRDIYDHTIQVIDTIETYRDMVSGLLDLYLSSVSNRTNQVMKVLTIIATIFIPLTFIAGVYGMNFEFMPELKWAWAYFAVLVLMFAVAIGMLFYFRKNKWL